MKPKCYPASHGHINDKRSLISFLMSNCRAQVQVQVRSQVRSKRYKD